MCLTIAEIEGLTGPVGYGNCPCLGLGKRSNKTAQVRKGWHLMGNLNINYRDLEIQLLVNERLNQAVENGYDESKDDPKLVAQSLADEDSDIERLVWDHFDGDETILIPFIKVWQQRRLA